MWRRWRVLGLALIVALGALLLSSCGGSAAPATLRLEVFLTPEELATFQPAIAALGKTHPEWKVVLETTPQSGMFEKINAQLAGKNLPDVVRAQGLTVQQWIRQGAFLDLTERVKQSSLDLNDFYASPMEQYRWQGKVWGLPDTAAPDVVYYNKKMFDAAGLAYPTDDWTHEDMRQAAIKLTLDARGRHPTDPGFDPQSIQQWGWSRALTMFWARQMAQAFGGDFCVNEDCTQMSFTSPAAIKAVQWWADLVQRDHASIAAPEQIGIVGDAFIAGKAAMGATGFFAVGQLKSGGTIQYDIVQPFKGVDGQRHTPLSTNGYVISATSQHPDAAWALVQALLEPQFLAETWGKPGHSVPARRSAAASVINPSQQPAHQQAIVAAMEYGEVFKPYTPGAFEVYSKTSDLFVRAMTGDIPVAEAMQQVEAIANEALSRDRTP